jgi:Uncharacterised protein family (UPF0236)
VEVNPEHLLMRRNTRFRMSGYLQEMSCYAGQAMVFSEASEFMFKYMLTEVTAKQIERVSHYYGSELEQRLNTEIEKGGSKTYTREKSPYYIMPDGHMLLTREEGWKEMKLGRIFKASARVEVSPKRNCITESVYVSHLGGHKEFEEKMEYMIEGIEQKIFISDGAKWIQQWIESMYPQSLHILDYYHAKEHLCHFAEAYYGQDTEAKNTWIEQQEKLLLLEDASVVIKNISSLPKTGKRDLERKRKELLNYYQSNLKRMNYKTYKQMGLLIGSGPIEAAHRNVIQQRMKRSGQRWTKEGLQQIANLRVASKSNQWDSVVNMMKMAA